jgi:hypothetical protein
VNPWSGEGRLDDRVWLVSDLQGRWLEHWSRRWRALQFCVDPASFSRWLGLQTLSSHLYVVDPLGSWMMRFPADLDATCGDK